jgi:Domain of unknown function (DUF397)
MPIKIDEWFVPRRTSNGGTCVETKFTENTVYVRNNLRPDAGTAEFAHKCWTKFVDEYKDIVESMPPKIDEWFVPRRTSNGTTCVETKFTNDAVYVRNSHRPDAGTAEFNHDEWTVFIASVRDGDYDL